MHTGKPTPAGYAAAQGSLYFGVPTVWSRVVDDLDAALALSSARLLVSGSAALPVPVFDRLAETHRPQAGRAIRHHRNADHAEHPAPTASVGPGWVGLPLSGVQTRLVDDDGARGAA